MALYDALRDALWRMSSDLTAMVEPSLALSAHDMPAPDILLTREPRGPGAVPLASVALIVEVADSSLDFDLGTKARLYASAGVPEYWVADCESCSAHQMWAPAGAAFRQRCRLTTGQRIEAATVAGLAFDLPSLS